MGSVLTVAMMFEYLGWKREAKAIDAAVHGALREGKTPAELGGMMGTREIGEWLANSVAKAGVQ
jgi:isocitrate/isopropylmalate dehydrogenase